MLRAIAQITIKIETTAASSIAVIPLSRSRSNLRLEGIDFGLLTTEPPPEKDGYTYTSTNITTLREVGVKLKTKTGLFSGRFLFFLTRSSFIFGLGSDAEQQLRTNL
jgi:hypothetical protein